MEEGSYAITAPQQPTGAGLQARINLAKDSDYFGGDDDDDDDTLG